MTVNERIKARRKELGLSADFVAENLGVSRATVYRYESADIENMGIDKIEPLAKVLKTTPAYLMGWEGHPSNIINLTPPEHMLVNFPVVGSISAGYSGIAAEEYTGEYVPITLSALHGPLDEYFVLRVSGDSMYPYLLDGDLVLVHRASMVENGKVAVVLYNGDEATIKRVNYKIGEFIELIPNNPEYKTRRIQGEDLNECLVLGEVVKLMRDVL